MREVLTGVEIAFYPEFINFWLRFGAADGQHVLDQRRSLALFGPGKIFGYVRWHADTYGTQDWRIVIVQTGAPPQALTRLEGVHPGGNILLSATGNARVKRVLTQLDALEAGGFDPASISPAHVRDIHNRIAVSQPIAPYSDDQQTAFQAARAVRS